MKRLISLSIYLLMFIISFFKLHPDESIGTNNYLKILLVYSGYLLLPLYFIRNKSKINIKIFVSFTIIIVWAVITVILNKGIKNHFMILLLLTFISMVVPYLVSKINLKSYD